MNNLTRHQRKILSDMSANKGLIIKLQSREGLDLDYQASDEGEAPLTNSQ